MCDCEWILKVRHCTVKLHAKVKCRLFWFTWSGRNFVCRLVGRFQWDRICGSDSYWVTRVLHVWPGLHTCFSCRKTDRETEACAVSSCGRFYHRGCALLVESTQLHKNRIHCPLHTCATCYADADDDDIECLRQQAVRGTPPPCLPPVFSWSWISRPFLSSVSSRHLGFSASSVRYCTEMQLIYITGDDNVSVVRNFLCCTKMLLLLRDFKGLMPTLASDVIILSSTTALIVEGDSCQCVSRGIMETNFFLVEYM